MVCLKRLVLDVLKPHQPDALECTKALARLGVDYRIKLTMTEMDERTQTLQIVIQGEDLDFERIQETITNMGCSLRSIDEVEATGAPGTTTES